MVAAARLYNAKRRYDHKPARAPITSGTIHVATKKIFMPRSDHPLWIAVHV
jgi:hypothetical protein